MPLSRGLGGGVTGAAIAAVILAAAMLFVATPSAEAAACPDVEVIFARGRLEPPGAGQIGNAFVSALRDKTGKNVRLYAVNYPADNQIDMGADDMSRRVQSTAASCPNTRLVVGGYSLGAAATDMALAMPFGLLGFKNPLPDGMDQHIAAVALFGNGIQWAGPLSAFNPAYADRTIDLCHGDDPICNPTDPDNWNSSWPDHLAPAYIKAGMVNQAADFVAGKV